VGKERKDKVVEVVSVQEHETSSDGRVNEIQALAAEIVALYYEQIFSQSSVMSTPTDVCKAFSDILLRHWNLCCMVIYLRGEREELTEIAVSADQYLDEDKTSRLGRVLVSAMERENRELQVWVGQENGGAGKQGDELTGALARFGIQAGICVPVRVEGALVGALVVVTSSAEHLRAAINGLRFIAAPVMIAVGNARRTVAMREQHHRIEHLVEELQQRSQALEEANRELRRVAQYRSLFLSRMSHELRTPLTSILGFTEILIDHENLTDAQRRFCEKIQSSGLQLQASLTQLVDLSRIEAGQTELFLHEFSLREALRDSCAAVSRLAQKQDVKIACVSRQELPTIVSDEGKLRQVLYNFLAFAINRSPAGAEIRVGAECVSPASFQVKIEDEGEPLLDLARVFEPVDIEKPNDTMTSMNELGLVIARRLIDMLGGSVELKSSRPHGLQVSIELPARPTKG
jgi:signal transduction histidine kinase